MAGISWAESYLGQLRALAGERPMLFVGARAIVRDDSDRVLLIKRSDNGRWALPAGAMELGESITDCGVRELYEETGLRASRVTPYALYTGPAYTFTNMYSHTYQLFMVAFRVDEWAGELVRVTEESTDARFFAQDELPGLRSPVLTETLADLAAFERTGQLVLK
ncbi:MAG TPA: NUDIX domain-containing protein [Micromonosporaceae bacterium]|nr:NUDIX domain-containing protein [Micromonosporaceae bacterium]